MANENMVQYVVHLSLEEASLTSPMSSLVDRIKEAVPNAKESIATLYFPEDAANHTNYAVSWYKPTKLNKTDKGKVQPIWALADELRHAGYSQVIPCGAGEKTNTINLVLRR